MSSATVAKTVAKKLKYYLDVQRREDGFDLSGPCHPREDPVPLRAGPTLDYDGIHDRSLKHYFHNSNVKKQLQQMHTARNQDAREGTVRGFMDQTMASVDYRLKPGPISPYAIPQTVTPKPPPHRPQATMTVDQYMKTKRGAKRRKLPVNVVGKPRRILRRSPPQHVSRDERERLVNMATKLIVATETVALPATKKQSKGFQASEKDIPRLQREKKRQVTTESLSSDSEGSQKVSRRPAPPKGKPRSGSAPHRRPESTFFKSSSSRRDGEKHGRSGVHVLLPGGSQSDDEDRLRSLVGRMNLEGRGSSVIASKHQSKETRPKSAAVPQKSRTEEDSYDDEEFESGGSPRLSSTRTTPRQSWMESEHEMIDMSTQTVVHSGTQTVKQYDEEQDQIDRHIILPSRLSPIKQTPLERVQEVYVSTETATVGASTADIPTSTPLSTETQTRNRDLEPKVLTYEVYILTGDKLGAGTKAAVKMTIFGEYGNSGERQLLRSRTHRSKFQRGQVDIFVIDSVFLGKLSSIRIGHNETKLGYGWFLDKVYIKEGPEATRAFEFKCNRWLSSRDDDGQIIRDLPVCDVLPASHLVAVLPRIDERQDEDFFRSASDSDSFSSDEDNVPAPDLREAKKKPKNQEESHIEKTSKHVTEPVVFKPPPVPTPRESEVQEDGFIAVKAENLFDISEGEDDKQGVTEELENEKFFDPDDKSDNSESEDEEENSRAQGKKRREEAENSSESEEEGKDEEEETEGGKRAAVTKNGSDNLKLVTTAMTSFKKAAGRKTKDQEFGAEEQDKEEEKIEEKRKVEEQEKEDESGENEVEQEKDIEKAAPEKEEEEEEEPRVEFTGDTKPENERERPISAQSEEFFEGFKAGVRAKHEKERERHRESVHESESVLRKGISIHDAAKTGNLDRIKELISVVPEMKNRTDERGMNPLHLAAANGRLDCVKWLAVSGVDLAEETPTGYTAMHLAAMNGHVNCMMILSAMGSTLSSRTIDELTPLHLACMSGFTECVKWLIANRAKIDVVDNNGRTPLDIAEEYGHEDLVKLLRKFKKELTRQDSTLAQLMTSESKRRKSIDSMGSDQDGVPSKVSDSGVGGLESGEDSWISDTEEDLTVETMKDSLPDSATRQRPGSGRERPESASRARTDSIMSMENRKKNFEKQQSKMKKRNSSFLDSIRMEVENEEEF
ncbi:unnamed protein product [Porites lobata]|uniref:PLAT domain-containing protein n=1 Tax=Porites lobata TaxID=104759 RepID=A0ABN8NRD4_9CNID|nr:unnamed protein product [Porites lobata]